MSIDVTPKKPFHKPCTKCKEDLPFVMFKHKADNRMENDTFCLRSWCTDCENLATRKVHQKLLKYRYDNDDASVDICPGCGFYFSRFAGGVGNNIMRDKCKPCLKIVKLQKNKVFQEAKTLLLEYASDQYAVQNFIKKYSIK